MFIEFTDTFYVSKEDINEMVTWCKAHDKATPEQAFWCVAAGWDDCDYYNAHYVEEKVVEIVKRILAGETIELD
jgi:hypothetical protein